MLRRSGGVPILYYKSLLRDYYPFVKACFGKRPGIVLEAVLKGEGTAAHRDAVALNTALVLWAAGIQSDLSEGVKQALTSLEAGQPWHRLVSLRDALEGRKEE